MKRHELWRRAAKWSGWSLDKGQLDLLDRYRDWLLDEALVAGGIGPAEPERIDTRHVADSLVFAIGLNCKSSRVVDLGSGVGLPGIPLAILMPETEYQLIDRSGRRVDLMKRAVRVLDLRNVRVTLDEIDQLTPGFPAIVSRATLTPDRAVGEFSRLLDPGGVAVIGGSWDKRPQYFGGEIVKVPTKILDHEVWILIIRQT